MRPIRTRPHDRRALRVPAPSPWRSAMPSPSLLAPALADPALPDPAPVAVAIGGYRPGALGRVLELQGRFYRVAFGFDAGFEVHMARQLASFVEEFRPDRDGLWLALRGEEILGSVAIDGRGADTDAASGRAPELRFFILDPAARGLGLGRRLLNAALRFADGSGYDRLELDTHADLHAAIHLYEGAGFHLVGERVRELGGRRTTMRRYERLAPHTRRPAAEWRRRESDLPV